MSDRKQYVVVQHSFGELGSGGPIGVLTRLLDTPLAEKYDFVRMHQDSATGGFDIPRIKQWAEMLREVQPDLVHVRGLGNEGFHGVLAARLARCPRILVSIHGSVRDLQMRRRLKDRVLINVVEPATLRLATHVTTVCESMADREFVKRNRDKFVGPITNGVAVPVSDSAASHQTRESLGLSASDIVLVSVGRLTWEKGHGVFAAALSELGEGFVERVKVLVVGDGPDAEGIREAYGHLGGMVRFLGRRDDVGAILSAADVFVFPTFHENLSNALLEAMAAGLPVVASRVGGNTEVVSRGGGILVDAKDVRGLSQALESMVKSPSNRREMGLAGRRVVQKYYSLDVMSEKLDEVYTAVLGSGAL